MRTHTQPTAESTDPTLARKAALLSGASQWRTRGDSGLGVPPMHMSDGPNGLRKQSDTGDNLGIGESLPATCFPSAVTLGMAWDVQLAERMGRALGAEARALDVNVLLGPGLCLKRNPLCGRNFEYFSEDPQIAGRIAAGLVRGIQSNGIAACPKHFAANSQELRRMASNSVVDERTLRELYLTGFEIVVRESAPKALMTSYNRVNGTYANENEHLLHILRDEWGFDGIVVSDWGGSDNEAAGVRAGANIEMPGAGLVPVRELVEAVERGELDEAYLDARIAELKNVARETQIEPETLRRDERDRHDNRDGHGERDERDGRDEQGATGAESASPDVRSPQPAQPAPSSLPSLPEDMRRDHQQLAVELAEQCVTLLRNESHTLPLGADSQIAVVGDLACTPRFQGAGSAQVNSTESESLLHALTRTDGVRVMGYAQGYERDGKSHVRLIREAARLCRNGYVNAVVAVVGLPESKESEGIDRSDMRLPRVQDELVNALVRTGKPVIVVLVGGSAMELPWANNVDAIVYAGLPGQGGSRAIANVLAGHADPCGHLTETWPLHYEDVPSAGIYPAAGPNAVYQEGPLVGYRYYETAHVPVRFPFGFGLSYSEFEYQDLQVTREGASCTVRNVSSRDGLALVQLYVTPAPSGGVPVARELKGFAKVFVPAGASARVTIAFDRYTFRHFDTASGRWRVTSGEYGVSIGTNARDQILTSSIFVDGDMAAQTPDSALGAYLQAHPKQVTTSQLAALFGGVDVLRRCLVKESAHEGAPGMVMTADDPLSSWRWSRSLIARGIALRLHRRAYASLKGDGIPDLNAFFVLYATPNALKKLGGGRLDQPMVDAIVSIANGKTVHGGARLVRAWVANRRANRAMRRRLKNEGADETD
ncbi:glycoside hydrolase family 3 C-terminal domain-containing protein [Bifidobacterium gallicum]|uniref:Beta-glucosidase n=1 Tax=Bifidobacterium gallicum DSM 20093 = LMG 11596 TaxID=561180 RepID=D1NWG2_9BIFI|nr:glycoside hydrolase family 3 C-terminal domain-containing protein [Bifidobacterium gallicum]EFA22447.1 glycosyl hydrolase family 3 N-terminal domain protein [Bifidobacterium gallicum DSM 20093 = LMG 11596]KFI60132.1 beta-glucosidase [Bifidobacterium gallicum DSM 20093 = LMG 11596]